jgi:hypothetical protein
MHRSLVGLLALTALSAPALAGDYPTVRPVGYRYSASAASCGCPTCGHAPAPVADYGYGHGGCATCGKTLLPRLGLFQRPWITVRVGCGEGWFSGLFKHYGYRPTACCHPGTDGPTTYHTYPGIFPAGHAVGQLPTGLPGPAAGF